MASAALSGRLCVAAPVPAAIVAVALHVASRFPAAEGSSADSLAAEHALPLGLALHLATVVGLSLVTWAGAATLRRADGTLGAPLTSVLVLFFAYVAGINALMR